MVTSRDRRDVTRQELQAYRSIDTGSFSEECKEGMMVCFRGDDLIPMQELYMAKVMTFDLQTKSMQVEWWQQKVSSTNWKTSGWQIQFLRNRGRATRTPFTGPMSMEEVIFWGPKLSSQDKLFAHDVDNIVKHVDTLVTDE